MTNGTSRPGNLYEQPAPRPEQLCDADLGYYSIRTITGSYLLDLTQRRLMRTPATIGSGDRSLTFTFEIDRSWLPLVALSVCAVGEPMRATVRIAGAAQPLRTSPVQAIDALEPE